MRKLLLLILVLLAIAAYRSVLFVDETETAIVTQFGRPVDAHRVDWRAKEDFPWVEFSLATSDYGRSGLHLKLPYQSAIRIDRRLQLYDPRTNEFLTKEKKNVDLDVFVCWRVADPRRFLETVNDRAGAEASMHDIVWSKLAAEVGRRGLDELASTDPEVHDLDGVIQSVAQQCAVKVSRAYGIEIVDVRLKRIGLPSQVRESVFGRMRKERQRIADQYRSEGEEEATKIRAAADKERTILLARANAEAERIRGDAEATATRTYVESHQTDPAFYELLRTLEAYKKFLDDQTTILLSADSDLLKFLTSGSMLSETNEDN